MSRILESVEKHYDNGLELNFDTLYQVLRTLQTNMKQNFEVLMFRVNGSLIVLVQ